MKQSPKNQQLTLTADQISVLCYQLSLVGKAGVPWESGIEALQGDAKEPWQKALLEQLGHALRQGLSLDAALKETGAFPRYLLHMVEIGQAAGQTEQVFDALSTYYRQEDETERAMRRMVVYPCLMGVLIAVILLTLMTKVLPVFEQVFDQLGMSLSLTTQLLLRFGQMSKGLSVALAVLLLLGAAVLGFFFYTDKGRKMLFQRGKKALSGRTAALAVDRSRFLSSMAMMLSSGLPIDRAMEYAVALLEGSDMEAALRAAREQMEKGLSFPKAVEQAEILDNLQCGLLLAGFRGGDPDQTLREIAARCQQEAQELLSRRLGRFEYVLLFVLCASVGVVLLSVMLPLLGVMSTIGA